MNIDGVVAELKKERDRLERAIAALVGETRARANRSAARKRGGISAAARQRLSMLMKKRWAERRRKGKKRL